ncbi:hypothetical protein EB796_006743 [Bugula neritina]|uniref:Uncharacterized protein n=1 Tax=Bugula neritina TaxID=10212 RepID=A0A7J7K9U4_BUGNE|nr:hypothetical protein EB796_006743 [Bugula neritina]
MLRKNENEVFCFVAGCTYHHYLNILCDIFTNETIFNNAIPQYQDALAKSASNPYDKDGLKNENEVFCFVAGCTYHHYLNM